MRREQWWPPVRDLAEEQGGLFTAAQARTAGARRPQLADLLHAGTIDRVQHGIYRLTGTPPDLWEHARAAWLALDPNLPASDRLQDPAGPGGVISHRTAARMLNLGDIDADHIDLTTPTTRTTRNPDVALHTANLTRDQWTLHAGLPVTTPETTITDLAATGTDLGHLATVTRDAALKHDVDTSTLEAVLDHHANSHGYTSGRELLTDLLQTAGAPAAAVDVGMRTFVDELHKTLAAYPNITPDHITKALGNVHIPTPTIVSPRIQVPTIPQPQLSPDVFRELQRNSSAITKAINTTAVAQALSHALEGSPAVETLRQLREQLAARQDVDD